jgi:hypothetical protein
MSLPHSLHAKTQQLYKETLMAKRNGAAAALDDLDQQGSKKERELEEGVKVK